MKKTQRISAIFAIYLIFMCFSAIGNAETINWDALTDTVIQLESSGDPGAYNSRSGAIGLMQVMPSGALAEWNMENGPDTYDRHDLYHPGINKRIGSWYLKRLHDRYKCDTIEKVLAGYNCGPTKLRRLNFDVSRCPQETRTYVAKGIKLYNERIN